MAVAPLSRAQAVGAAVPLHRGAGPRVAIACSGLGRVRRGNETWARSVAEQLHAVGARVTLFGGSPTLDVRCQYVGVRNWPRDSFLSRAQVSWGNRYRLEQESFALFLHRRLVRDGFDVVHVADPLLAFRLKRLLPPGGPRVLYKDGLLLGPPWCRHFDHVQVLAPHYLDAAREFGLDTRGWSMIPHLVDPAMFAPAEDRQALRERLLGPGVGADELVVMGVGDFSPESNKRLDWLVLEAGALSASVPIRLILLGQASPSDVAAFEQRANAVLGHRVRVVPNVAPDSMPDWYRVADVFAHAALREPFGIVFLEAMASGLPLVGHRFAVTEWIIGDAGCVVDMQAPGELAQALARLADPAARAEVASLARRRAVSEFSPEQIVPRYLDAYEQIAGR